MYAFTIEVGQPAMRKPKRNIMVVESADQPTYIPDQQEVYLDDPEPPTKIVIQQSQPKLNEIPNQLTLHETQVQNERNRFKRQCMEDIFKLKQSWSAHHPNTDFVQTNYLFLGAIIGEHEIPSGMPAIEWHPLYIDCRAGELNNKTSFRLVPPPGRLIIPPCRDKEESNLMPIVIALKENRSKTLFHMTVYVVQDASGFSIAESDVFKTKSSEGVKTDLSVYEQSMSSVDATIPSKIIQKSIIAIKLISLTFTINEIDSVIMPPSWPILFFQNDPELLDIYNQYLHTVHASTNILPQPSTIFASNVAMILSSSDNMQKPGYFSKPMGSKENCIIS